MNCESEILRKKYLSESNTINNIKLAIIPKIRETRRTRSSSPRAASVLVRVGNNVFSTIGEGPRDIGVRARVGTCCALVHTGRGVREGLLNTKEQKRSVGERALTTGHGQTNWGEENHTTTKQRRLPEPSTIISLSLLYSHPNWLLVNYTY